MDLQQVGAGGCKGRPAGQSEPLQSGPSPRPLPSNAQARHRTIGQAACGRGAERH